MKKQKPRKPLTRAPAELRSLGDQEFFTIVDGKTNELKPSLAFGDVRLYKNKAFAEGLCTDPKHRVARVILKEVL